MSNDPQNSTALHLGVMGVLLLICVGLEYYFHILHGEDQAYSHLYYVPIIIATWWWGIKGVLPVSLFLGLMHMGAYLPDINEAVLSRFLTLVSIGFVMGMMSTRRRQAEEQLFAYQAQLQALASDLVLTEERERRDLAVELHDRIGQALAVSKIKLGGLQVSAFSPELAGPLQEVRALVDQTIQDTRSLTFDLSPPILYELGLEAAVEWLAEQMQEQHGLQIDVEDDGQLKPLDDDARVLLFRAVRELLVNVVKHARAPHTEVAIRRDGDNIRIRIEDDGIGFDPLTNDTHMRAGYGLFSIEERLHLLGGSFHLESAIDHGTRVVLAAPLKYPEQSSDEKEAT